MWREPETGDWRQRLAVKWTLREAMSALLLVFALYWLTGALVVLVGQDDLPVLPWLLYLGIFATGIIAAAAWITRRHGEGLASLGLKRERLGANAAVGLLGGIAGLIANVAVAYALISLLRALRVDISLPRQVDVEGVPGWQLAATIFVVVLVAPVVEELLFRGMLYPALRQRLGVGSAVIGSAALFAVLHLQWLSFLPLLAVGVILALLYESRGSLVAPMVAHAVNNGIVVAVALLLA